MKRIDRVISNWYVLVDNFSTSGTEFYDHVEIAIKERKVPDVVCYRNEFKEGGFASSKRLYLRIERDFVAFDLCAAQYGTGFFFSWWLTRLGPKHPILYLLLFLPIVGILSLFLVGLFASFSSIIAWIVIPTLILLACGFIVQSGAVVPVEYVLMMPVLGWLYEKLFNPVTYYSLDTALMFQESIRRAVNETIDSLLTQQGLQALREDQKTPVIKSISN